MKIGYDLDGTVSSSTLYNPSIRLPWWLFFSLSPAFLLSRPNKKAVKTLWEARERGDEIIIISARPPQFAALTKKWLQLYKIPYHNIFCVGFGKGTKQRKLEVIQKEKIQVFFDDDKRVVSFLKQNFIKAFLWLG